MRQRVNCSDLSSLARQGQLQQRLGDADVLAHLRQCGACEALYGAGNVGILLVNEADAHFDFDLDAMRSGLDAVLAAEARDPAAPLRALPTRWRVAIALGVALFTAAAVWAIWLRVNWERYPETRMWFTLAALVLVLALALRELFRPLTLIERPGYQFVALLGATLLPVLLALSPHDHALLMAPANPLLGAGKCLLLGLALALPTAACVLLGMRTPMSEASGSEMRSLWLSAGAIGLVGNLVLQLHCAFTTSGHLLFGHASLSVVWLCALWLWSRRVRQG
jgi:hypothetical protein